MTFFSRLFRPTPASEPMSNDAAQPVPEPLEPDAQAPETAADETITIKASDYEAAKREAGEWKERCMRSQAEFENARKRLRKEADEAGTRAIARFVKPILTELDNLERAVLAATPEAFAGFAQGVTMTQANLQAALRGAGIEQVTCEGVFDPAVHEVLAEAENGDVPKGTIVQVFRPGYKLKDQLVRAAQVVVAKPPAAGSAPAQGGQ
jgi:molecular chaperone GrpE